jgi:hypothetical protein
VDQQATRRPGIQSGATVHPSCLKDSQGVTPFLKVTGPSSSCFQVSITWMAIYAEGGAKLCRGRAG